MDLSENAKKRIDALSNENRAACCKKLKEGKYSSVRLQVRVNPNMLIDIYEAIEDLNMADMSAFLKSASLGLIKQNKKNRS